MKLTGKVLLATLALLIATVVSGGILSRLPLTPPASPPGVTPEAEFAATVPAALVLVAGLVPLALGLGGSFRTRWLVLGLLLFVTVGVNTVIELVVFSVLGGFGNMLVFNFLLFMAGSAVLARLFDGRQPAPPKPQFTSRSWLWRLGAAWLAFPVIYLIFGLCVAPFVVKVYEAGVFGLRVPPLDVILRTQLLRSMLFLGASLPVILLWTRSRRNLIVSLGIAHTVMVGLYGLVQAYWMPSILRVTHSLEITADSFAYAFVLAWLFFPQAGAEASSVVRGAPLGDSDKAEPLRIAM